MNRMLPLIAGFAVTLGAAVSVWAAWLWDASVEQGRQMYSRRPMIEDQLQRRRPELPAIAWMRDSTVVRGAGGVPPYPTLIARRLQRSRSYENLLVGDAGFDAYHHYCTIGPLLELGPEAIFIVANLRLFHAPPHTNWLDLTSFIPPAELGRAVWLPWHVRGATIPRVLLAQTLRSNTLEEIFFSAEGLRRLFQEEVLPRGPRADDFLSPDQWRRRMLGNYDEELDEGSPVVRMLAAAVEMATRRGVRVVVIVPPVPVHQLEKFGIEVPLGEHAAVLRRVVEAAGGELFSLYDLLRPEGFGDEYDHYSLSGATQMAEVLLPLVEASLPAPPDAERGRRGRSGRRSVR